MVAMFAVAMTIPPAAKVLAVIAVVYPLIQMLKKIPALTPILKGWVAIAVNVVLSACGLLLTVPADQLYTPQTLMALVTAILGAAGVHGTVSALSGAPDPKPGPPAKFPGKAALLLLAIVGPLALTGCPSWERSAFQSLAASKAAIDGAQAAYETSKATGKCPAIVTAPCIPHTRTAYDAISKAKQAQTAAEQALLAYQEMEVAASRPTSAAAMQAEVNAAMAALPPLLTEIKALYAQ